MTVFEVPEWTPRRGFFAVDDLGKVGEVVGIREDVVYLCPPGGGREWEKRPSELRPPNETELEWARVLTTPVVRTRAVPGIPDGGTRPRPRK
ncbi:hypothetical protein AB0C52_00730 [Streptomyces sp. NPDC048717]|uniref:hypothetical protein n=1 Tax=Streptomyces sp. NPDC048717 TaxID=3154928 RepID=UPI0034451280